MSRGQLLGRGTLRVFGWGWGGSEEERHGLSGREEYKRKLTRSLAASGWCIMQAGFASWAEARTKHGMVHDPLRRTPH